MVGEPKPPVLFLYMALFSECMLTLVQNKLGANMKTLESAEQIYAKRQAIDANGVSL